MLEVGVPKFSCMHIDTQEGFQCAVPTVLAKKALPIDQRTPCKKPRQVNTKRDIREEKLLQLFLWKMVHFALFL
jgi:hypothetical protein